MHRTDYLVTSSVSDVATGEVLGLELLLCGKCDVIFCYIYTNISKLILHLSYLVRLDCFSNAFN